MPIAGRKSKPEDQRRNRVKPVHDWTEVVNVPFEGGPKLPRTRTNGRAWSTRTRQKWQAWASMPHCVLWGPAEWDFALDSIELAALVHDGEPKHAAELRIREKTLGTTVDYLRDLRIRYVDPKQEQELPATVTSISEYRDL